jgi:hypothetical protein
MKSGNSDLGAPGDYGVSDLVAARTARVTELLQATPDIDVLTELLSIDPLTLLRPARIDYLAALERQTSWLQAAMQRAIVAVAGEQPSVADDMWAGVDDAEREDVAAALRLSGSTAQMRIDVARTLINHLPNTCSALASGEISPAHATVIARETASAIRDGLSPFAIFAVEERALAHAEFHTPAQVANKVRTTLARIAPEEFEDMTSLAHDTRRLTCYREADGMSTIVAILPAIEAQFVMTAIEALVLDGSGKEEGSNSDGKWRNDLRTMEMKRADALSELAKRFLSNASENVSSSSENVALSSEYVALSSEKIASSSEKIASSSEKIASSSENVASSSQKIASSSVNVASSSGKTLHHRRPITVNVTVDLPTLLGLAENPGQLAGYGAIPASLARSLASDAQWRRFITDPESGALLDYGRETYEPPKPLVDFLLARDRTCRFPGCRAPARLADLDHAQSWESGGGTSAKNLGVLCRRHHRLKTHGGWKLESESDGSCTWTSPENKQYFVPARDIQEAV